MIRTQDLNVKEFIKLPTPRELKKEFPADDQMLEQVVKSRDIIEAILSGTDNRFLTVVGPCSVHDVNQAIEYATWLRDVRERFPRLFIVMRACPDKPRTDIGWTGLSDDPHLDGSFDAAYGLRETRRLMTSVVNLGIPVGMEVLGPYTVRYVSDVLSYSWIGARSVNDQEQRRLASGLSMPVGFKNPIDGNVSVAVDAVKTARQRGRKFKGIDDDAELGMILGQGNPWAHIILRGNSKPNYHPADIAAAVSLLRDAGLPETIMIDASHGNSGKDPLKQEQVLMSVAEQRRQGNLSLKGGLIESNLRSGNQKIPKNVADMSNLKRGVSVTDACLSIQETDVLLERLNQALS